MTSGRTMRLGEALFGGGLIALALFIAVETATMPGAAARVVIGPTLFPYAIALGLAVIGLILLREARSAAAPHGGGLELDLPALGLVAGGLAAQFITLEAIGWIPSTAMLFALVARAFGNRRWGMNIAIGLGLAVLTYIVFTLGLDLDLPLGALIDSLRGEE